MDAIIRVKLGINPDSLSDEARLKAWAQIVYVEKRDLSMLASQLRNVAAELFGRK